MDAVVYKRRLSKTGKFAPAGTSNGTPGDAKCVTEIFEVDKNMEISGKDKI